MSSSAIDWEFAQKVAEKVATRNQLEDRYQLDRMNRDFEELTAQAEELVEIETGLISSEGKARARVADRPMWIAANIASFQRLLRPITDKLGENTKPGPMADMAARVGGAEVGAILGWMSTRVLGQYDLLLTEDEDTSDQDIVYYVGPNIMALERRFGFRPQQFRLWIALHECTHRAQFTGVPWLRDHFLSLVNRTLDHVEPDPKRLMEAAKEVVSAKRRGEDPIGDGGLPMLIATPEQREVLAEIGGMMSLLEGHGDVTMDRAGVYRVPDAPQFASTLRARRGSAKGLSRIMQRVIGLEAKLNQYAAGEDFIAAVEKVGGPALVNEAWKAPENLPSMAEIKNPTDWVDRVQATSQIVSAAG